MSFVFAALLLLQLAGDPPATPPLRIKLPYSCGTTWRCTQGNHGALTHSNPYTDFAWDFDLHEGTPVLSAAAGRVILVVQDYDATKPETSVSAYGNLVWIDHGSNRFTFYCHLQKGSAPVRAGDLVNAGQFIGLSGNTGNTTGPHLHFTVTDALWRSIPSRFVDVAGDGVPVEMKSYKSDNDGRGVSWNEGGSTLPLDVFAEGGISLTTSTLSADLDGDAAYLVRGTAPHLNGALRFFVTRFGNTEEAIGKTIPTSYGSDGMFQFWFQVPEFAKVLDQGGQFCLGLARIDTKGMYTSAHMVPFVFHRHDFDKQGRPLLHLAMPFTAGETHRYRRLVDRSEPVIEDMIGFGAEPGTAVLSTAAGRVIAVGVESDSSGKTAASSTSYVRLDHGDGFRTEYSGLATSSITVREGGLVHAGRQLGTSAKSVFASEPGFVFSMCAQAGCDTAPRFVELGESGFLDGGDITAQPSRSAAPPFRADSLLGETTFLENGVLDATGAPAHAFHCAHHYALTGHFDEGRNKAWFVARRRGQVEPIVRISGIAKDDGFGIDVCLDDRRKELEGGAWEWALAAAAEEADAAATHWEPLTLLW